MASRVADRDATTSGSFPTFFSGPAPEPKRPGGRGKQELPNSDPMRLEVDPMRLDSDPMRLEVLMDEKLVMRAGKALSPAATSSPASHDFDIDRRTPFGDDRA